MICFPMTDTYLTVQMSADLHLISIARSQPLPSNPRAVAAPGQLPTALRRWYRLNVCLIQASCPGCALPPAATP